MVLELSEPSESVSQVEVYGSLVVALHSAPKNSPPAAQGFHFTQNMLQQLLSDSLSLPVVGHRGGQGAVCFVVQGQSVRFEPRPVVLEIAQAAGTVGDRNLRLARPG